MRPRRGLKAEEQKGRRTLGTEQGVSSVPEVPLYTERQLDDMALEIQRRVTAVERAGGVAR